MLRRPLMDSPDFHHRSYAAQLTPEKRFSETKSAADNFIIDDLLDFSNDGDEENVITDGTFDNLTVNSTDSSSVTVVGSCNSGCDRNFSITDGNFSNELCVPQEELAELEWLSNFVEESFSSEDLQKLQLISGRQAQKTGSASSESIPKHQPDTSVSVSVPGKARSKRSRAAPCNWASRVLVVSPTTSSSESDVTKKQPLKKKIKEGCDKVTDGDTRKCLHCATDKTPQWRTGPMGPKTLCNACGVRFKSGRLVPEYRPASSPTFMLTKHSNSHRKVLELRRQKEFQMSPQNHQFFNQNLMFDVTNGDDYLIHETMGPTFEHLM